MSISRVRLLAGFLLWGNAMAGAQQVFINEFHYDNVSTDVNEGVEIAGPANSDLSAYRIVFYNGNTSTGGIFQGPVYKTFDLNGMIDDEGNGGGAVWFDIKDIQNGGPDGLVLVRISDGMVVHRISYEGSMTATDGPAVGQVLPDIGVDEEPAPAAGLSLQLKGAGVTGADFTWAAPALASVGFLNPGQVYSATPIPISNIYGNPGVIKEGQGMTLTLTLAPSPLQPVVFTVSHRGADLMSAPASVIIPRTGSATWMVQTLADGVVDGYHEVVLTLTDQTGAYPSVTTRVQIADSERPALAGSGALRVMSLNVLFGAGTPGTVEFIAVREVVERISPDVLVMQEVASAASFADVRAMLAQAGFPQGNEFIATTGDAFVGQSHARGELSGSADQSLVIASRFPFKKRVQLGRGIPGRMEVARWPMLGVIDVPWLDDAADPAVVTVHMKADFGDANDYRRAVEALRLRQLLAAEGISGTTGNVIVAGDFNATDWFSQAASYVSNSPPVLQPGALAFPDGTMLPQSFVAGADLLAGVTLPYRTFPHSGMNPFGLNVMDARHADGVDERTFSLASYKLDYFFVSQPILARRGMRVEIYQSQQESQYDGQPKRAALPAPDLTFVASDHYPLFADIPLIDQSRLELNFSQPWVWEGATDLTATVRVTPVLASARIISLSAWRDGRIKVPPLLTIPAGQGSVTFQVGVPYLSGIQPHRDVSVAASAGQCLGTSATVTVRNKESTGLLVISQYTEPAEGSGPRALELLNTSGRSIDFAATPLRILRFGDGDATGVINAEANSGMLPAGAVLVVGDAMTGNLMVSQSLIPAPVLSFELADRHSMYLNRTAHAAFLLDDLIYTGNDALEITLNGVRCDVFGEIGHDPRNGWTGPAAQTTVDTGLVLHPTISTGSEGWREPGYRFSLVPAGLAGFGIAPTITDPYFAWANSAGLVNNSRALSSDPDNDGASNLLEYGLLSKPNDSASTPGLFLTGPESGVARKLRWSDSSLTFLMEGSSDLRTWRNAEGTEQTVELSPNGDTTQMFKPALPLPGRYFLRQILFRR